MRLFLFSAIGFVLIIFMSCRKGDLPVPTYFGKIGVTLSSLPGTGDLDIYYGGKMIGSITSGKVNYYSVVAAKATLLQFMKAGTDSLIADTTITVTASEQLDFKVVNSKDLGLSGFVTNRQVAADSVSLQLVYNLGNTDYPLTTVNFYLWKQNNETYELELVDSILNLKKGELNPKLLNMPYANADGSNVIYAGVFTDPATGEQIIQSSGSPYVLMVADAPGFYYVVRFDEQSGDIMPTFTAL